MRISDLSSDVCSSDLPSPRLSAYVPPSALSVGTRIFLGRSRRSVDPAETAGDGGSIGARGRGGPRNRPAVDRPARQIRRSHVRRPENRRRTYPERGGGGEEKGRRRAKTRHPRNNEKKERRR